MDEVRHKLKEAIDLQGACHNSLNQTMRECLAKGKIFTLRHDHACNKGALSISREVDYDNIKDDNNIVHFVKSETKVQMYNDMELHKIKSLISEPAKIIELGSLIHRLELTNKIVPVGELKKVDPAPLETKSGVGAFSVYFRLTEIHGSVNFSRAVFTIETPKTTVYTGSESGTTQYTLLTGEDKGSNSLFFRWITHHQPTTGAVKHAIKECVLIFNQSHQLEIKKVVSPMSQVSVPIDITSFGVADDAAYRSQKLNKNNFQMSTGYKPDQHDPTFFFLRKQFPEERFIKSTNEGTGMVNENDISVFEQHSRTCIRDIAALHWAFSGLCSVLESMEPIKADDKISTKLKQIKLSYTSHNEMLHIIACAARLVTVKFKSFSSDTGYQLGNLYSPYNQVLVAASANGILDMNTDDYIGCKLTQWFIMDAETHMEVLAKKDQNTRMSKNIKVKLLKVDCNLSHTAIKTTHTTDVLIDIGRKAYLDPWKLIYPNGIDTLPQTLKDYSLSALPAFNHLKWAKRDQAPDKEISVVLRTKHLIRLTFHTFRQSGSLCGADPVAASKAIERAASKPQGKVEKVKSRRRVEELISSKPISFNDVLRRVNTGDEAATHMLRRVNTGGEAAAKQKFVFGGGAPTWSWNPS